MKQPISVFIIEEHRLFAEAIAMLLKPREAQICLVGSATHPSAALEKIKALTVDVLLIDALLERVDGVQVTRTIKEEFPAIKVIVLGLDDTEKAILQFIEAGANGYLLKAASFNDLVQTIEAVYEEQSPCSPKIAARVFARIAELSQEQSQLRAFQDAPLTPREKDILQLIAASQSNKEIARQLNIALPTVKNHVHSILDKLHVNYRREAAQVAFSSDLLSPPEPLGLSRTRSLDQF